MRITITLDSATPKQAYSATLAFQRTNAKGFVMPEQLNTRPTVTVAGQGMGWESPALYPEHAQALLQEFLELDQSTGPDGLR